MKSKSFVILFNSGNPYRRTRKEKLVENQGEIRVVNLVLSIMVIKVSTGNNNDNKYNYRLEWNIRI